MKIGPFEIGKKVFLIAEIGNNHNGSLERAIEMVDQAIAAGANCVKFQMRSIEHLYRKKSLLNKDNDLGSEYLLDLLNRFELSVDEHKKIFNYCLQRDITYLCTPWETQSASILESFGVCAYKIASADLTNVPLIQHLAKTRRPLILSTGMSAESEIFAASTLLKKLKVEFIMLHCNSAYPAPFDDINLKWMVKLQRFSDLVGYSGHERGISVSLAAVALGAVIIERHFTLDRNMEGPDHAASLTPDQFKALCEGIREIELALGNGATREVSQGEMINRENLGKSLIAAKNIKKGTKLTAPDIEVRSPGQGLSVLHYDALIGTTIKRDLAEEDFFFLSDIKGDYVEPKKYKFLRPWGIPIRYHDFLDFSEIIKPDLWEFHLSYSDMTLEPRDFIPEGNTEKFVVHAPELFANSELMDLASPNEEYRNKSIISTQKVVDITRELKHLFPQCSQPLIVANIGGFTRDCPLPKNNKNAYYERFADSLGKLDLDGVELIPQTMAPFPWHFGGQRYQNLFVEADEIVKWCEKLHLRVCFDVSHSRLACNYLNADFYQFVETISRYCAHLHLGDAKGTNGEGLQIGAGDIDFSRLSKILERTCPAASFIPEIWQGHKNFGEGFWIALNKLNNEFSVFGRQK